MPARSPIPNPGDVFGRLTILAETTPANTHRRFICRCECGKEKVVERNHLLDGHTTSCGCYMSEVNGERGRKQLTIHGLFGTPEYAIFSGIKDRCLNPRCRDYPKYGGRGIRLEWGSVVEFVADMGPRPFPEATVDRKDVNGNYSKQNCRWATQLQQQNNKRNNIFFELHGERRTLSEWCRALRLDRGAVDRRLRKGREFADVVAELRGAR